MYYTFELPSQSEIKVATMVRDHKQKPTNNKTHAPFYRQSQLTEVLRAYYVSSIVLICALLFL